VPFTFLAHQAPVLPLKMARPRWFSGAGLAIGSMAPDFEKFVHGVGAGRFGHTLLGQLLYCLPMSLAVYWLLTRVAAPSLARHAPDLGRFHLRDYAASLAATPRRPWLLVAASALVGSASHVAFDGFTHADPRVVALFPFLRSRIVLVHGHPYLLQSLLQVGASVAGAVVTVALLYVIGRQRRVLAWRGIGRAAGEPGASATVYWTSVAAITIALSALLAWGAAATADGFGVRDFTRTVIFRLPLTGFLAVCAAALMDRRVRSGSGAHPAAAYDAGTSRPGPGRRVRHHSRTRAR